MTRATPSLGGLHLANTDASTSELWWDRTDPDLRMILAPETAWRALTRTFGAQADDASSDHAKLIVNGAAVTDRTQWLQPSTGEILPSDWDLGHHTANPATKGHDS